MVLVPILLLNMLIAMMGNTYAHVIEQSEKEWMKQVFMLINKCSQRLLKFRKFVVVFFFFFNQN